MLTFQSRLASQLMLERTRVLFENTQRMKILTMNPSIHVRKLNLEFQSNLASIVVRIHTICHDL